MEASAQAPRPLIDEAVTLDELRGRLAALRAELARRDLDLAVLTTPESICYLSGYQTRAVTASQALVVPRDGGMVLVIRRMDEGNYLVIRDRSPVARVVSAGPIAIWNTCSKSSMLRCSSTRAASP